MGAGKSENEKAEQILQASSEECCWDLVLEAMPMGAQESEVFHFFHCGWQKQNLSCSSSPRKTAPTLLKPRNHLNEFITSICMTSFCVFFFLYKCWFSTLFSTDTFPPQILHPFAELDYFLLDLTLFG